MGPVVDQPLGNAGSRDGVHVRTGADRMGRHGIQRAGRQKNRMPTFTCSVGIALNGEQCRFLYSAGGYCIFAGAHKILTGLAPCVQVNGG